MSDKPTKAFTQKIEAFKEALSAARQDIVRAGKLLVEMIEENENATEILIRDRIAPRQLLEALEEVGRGKLDPLLLTDPSPAAQRALSQAMPMADQRRLTTGFVPVAVKNSSGGFEVQNKRMEEINVTESYRVIGDGKIRSPEEQMQIIQQQEAERALRERRFVVRGDKIEVIRHAVFSWKEWMEIGEMAKPKPIDIQASIQKNQIAKK